MLGDLSWLVEAADEFRKKFPDLWHAQYLVLGRASQEVRFSRPANPLNWYIDPYPYLTKAQDERAGEFKFPKIAELKFEKSVAATGKALEDFHQAVQRAAEPHVMGLSAEVIDPVKYKEFMRSL